MSEDRSDCLDLDSRLLAAVRHISGAADFQGALAAAIDDACRLVGCDGASALWLAGDHLEVLASQGQVVSLPGLALPIGQVGRARAVLDSGRAMMVADTAADMQWRSMPGEEHVRSWLGAPLLVDGRPIGLLTWTSGEPEWFDPEDVEAATALAQLVAPILHRVQLLDDTRRRLRQAIQPRAARPGQGIDTGSALRQVCREAMDFAAARHAFVFLIEEGTRRLRCAAAAGDRSDQLKSATLRGDGTLGGWGMPVARSLDRAADRLGPGPSDREVMASLGIARTFILPLRAGREPVGMLGVAETTHGRPLDQDAIRLMTQLASQASLVVERAAMNRSPAETYDYEALFQSSPLGLCALTVGGDIQVCNPALVGLLARSDRSLAGRTLADFVTAADWLRLSRALDEVSVTGQRQSIDTLIRSTQGEQRHVRVTLARTGERGGAGATLIAVLEDVTWLKLLEQERVDHMRELREKNVQLQELDQLRTRFVSNVSHELRTPLAVIKLYATLIRKGRPEKQTYYSRTIEQETQRLETMVENILDLTRLDRDTLRLHPEPLAAKDIIAQVLEVYQESAHKRGIELKNRVPDGLPHLTVDKNDLIQMLTNLVDNAMRYTGRGGQVWVSARQVEDRSRPMLEISVGDTGIGIPPDEQARVFERFYRGSNNNAGTTGTGLGLAIVQELMAHHGGCATVTSQVGQGSVFALLFPLDPDVARPAPGPDPETEMGGTGQ